MKSPDGLDEGSSKGSGRNTAEVRCVGLHNSSAAGESNMREGVVKEGARVLSLRDETPSCH